jgi:superfamily II DNA/RNA helicase
MMGSLGEISRQRKEVALAKIPAVIEHLESALEQGPVVCFAHHKAVVAALREQWPDASVITGDTPAGDRQEQVDRFQDGKTDLFLGSIKAAGVGITLVRSSHVVFAELDWTPGWVSQAEDRCHRIGQDDAVLVQHLVFDGSLDATIAQMIVDKQEVISQALDVEHEAIERAEHMEIPLDPSLAETKGQKKIREEAETLTKAQIDVIHMALIYLSDRCDGAQAEDGQGFNKFDTRLGKELAARDELTPKQAAMGRKLVIKYGGQLRDEIVAAAKGESK